MAAFNPPKELNGIPLSERSRWLMFAPTWTFFPKWRRDVMERPYQLFEGDSPLLTAGGEFGRSTRLLPRVFYLPRRP